MLQFSPGKWKREKNTLPLFMPVSILKRGNGMVMVIDLRKEYPHLDATYSNFSISCKIATLFEEYRLAEQALEKRRTRNGDVVSLDTDPGIELHIMGQSPGPEEEMEKRIGNQQLYAALRLLPRKQVDRIYAHYILGMSIAEIARAEQVSKPAVLKSIALGKVELKRILSKRSEKHDNR